MHCPLNGTNMVIHNYHTGHFINTLDPISVVSAANALKVDGSYNNDDINTGF